MTAILDDRLLRELLLSEQFPDWLDPQPIFTTPRWATRLAKRMQAPTGGQLSKGLTVRDLEQILLRLKAVKLTPAVPGDHDEQSLGEVNGLPPLWREAIAGAALLKAELFVVATEISDRNIGAISTACRLLAVNLRIVELVNSAAR